MLPTFTSKIGNVEKFIFAVLALPAINSFLALTQAGVWVTDVTYWSIFVAATGCTVFGQVGETELNLMINFSVLFYRKMKITKDHFWKKDQFF